MQCLGVLVVRAEFHAEEIGRLEHLIEDQRVVQVLAAFHGNLERLFKLCEELVLLALGIACDRKDDLLGDTFIARDDHGIEVVGIGLVVRRVHRALAPGFQLGDLSAVLGDPVGIGLILGGALLDLGLALLFERSELRLHILDSAGGFGIVGGVGLLVQRPEIVVAVDDIVFQCLAAGLEIRLFVEREGLGGLDLALELLDLLEIHRAAAETGIAVEHFQRTVQQMLVAVVEHDVGLCQAVIREDDAALGDEAVGIEHAGKGLGQHGLARAGLADDGEGLVFIHVQRDVADRREDTAADVELDLHIFQGEQYLSIFHSALLTCVFSGQRRQPGSGPSDTE